MTEKTIIVGPSQARREIAETLAAAFQDDPSLCWLMPDAELRRRRLLPFFRLVTQEDQLAGMALIAPSFEVATLWRSPGRQKDNPLGALWTNLRFLWVLRSAVSRGSEIAKAMAQHHPSGDHWYLRYAGVAPEAQGKGWGGLALREGIRRADGDNMPIYLETAKLSNVSLYQRFGFEVIEEWDVPSGGPHFWSMMRHPSQPA